MNHSITGKFTPKQKLFCENYIDNGFNATKAARDAGYSEQTAKSMAAENLAKPYLNEYIQKRMKEIFEKVGLTIELRAKKLMQGLEMSIPDKEMMQILPEEIQKEILKNVDIRAGVACIAEANKMDGSYAAETHAVLVEESTNNIVQEKIEKFEKEY